MQSVLVAEPLLTEFEADEVKLDAVLLEAVVWNPLSYRWLCRHVQRNSMS